MADNSVVLTSAEVFDSSVSFKPTDFPRLGRARAESGNFELSELKPWFTLVDDEEEEEE
ncbi:hypothetical protein SAMN03159444_02763 [Pseudomonas sp. NFACC02]|jgi:hypothetical protein|uniref:hypothetical protein n=1 Tax=Pseudomonas sp. NFACC02 TaxID=1566250 RepID=UPI0008ADCC76|nr:hypothetical protein [Pseudomonas sp. NFACC02]SEQ91646.1 hypothetical protein SAMN03159444_02763 [Pseudomonas sp. NFACC02]